MNKINTEYTNNQKFHSRANLKALFSLKQEAKTTFSHNLYSIVCIKITKSLDPYLCKGASEKKTEIAGKNR